jgi:hypothetical protein
VELISYRTANEVPATLAGEHDSEQLASSYSFPVLTPEALAAGMLALNATHVVRRLTGAWGGDEFFLNETDALLARRNMTNSKRRRSRKQEPKEPQRLSKAREGVFAENCLLSLLDMASRPGDETQHGDLSGSAWFWAKLTALAGAATGLARMFSKRLSPGAVGRLKPQAPRYTGPTLWQ